MTISVLDSADLSTPKRPAYDHPKIAEQAILNPGKWVTDTSGEMPSISGSHVRHGRLVAYRPAGAFALRRLTGEGGEVGYICFLGVPVEPWEPGEATPYAAVKRTLNPKKVPVGTPAHIVDLMKKARKLRK